MVYGLLEGEAGSGARPWRLPAFIFSWSSWAWAMFAGLQCSRDGHATGPAPWRVAEGINCYSQDWPLRTPDVIHILVPLLATDERTLMTWRGKEPPDRGSRVPEGLCRAEKCPLPDTTTC